MAQGVSPSNPVGGEFGPPRMYGAACPPDPNLTNQFADYLLAGPQVEPTAGLWADYAPAALPHVVPLTDILALTADPNSPFFIPPYPTAPEALRWEIEELKYLADLRDTPASIAGDYSQVRPFPAEMPQVFRDAQRDRISDFIQLRPPPFGTIFDINAQPQPPIDNVNQQHLRRGRAPNYPLPPVVTTGRQLARMFQDETPGLLHRHMLDYLLYKQFDISPPRQARIWMALDVTIYSALCAAWYYKWLAPPDRSYRQRPYEYDQNTSFRVLYDDIVDDLGAFNQCAREQYCPSPGTPRHPAYPSGHSTYSAAASALLSYFFPADAAELDILANNIGVARLWGGVHWRSDHIAGQRIGRAVASHVIQQLQGNRIPVFQPADQLVVAAPPSRADVITEANDLKQPAPAAAGPHDAVPSQRTTPFPDCDPGQPRQAS